MDFSPGLRESRFFAMPPSAAPPQCGGPVRRSGGHSLYRLADLARRVPYRLNFLGKKSELVPVIYTRNREMLNPQECCRPCRTDHLVMRVPMTTIGPNRPPEAMGRLAREKFPPGDGLGFPLRRGRLRFRGTPSARRTSEFWCSGRISFLRILDKTSTPYFYGVRQTFRVNHFISYGRTKSGQTRQKSGNRGN